MARRLAEALHPNKDDGRETEETETELDAAMSFSDREQLRGMDFEKMSLEELARAKTAIAKLRLPVQEVPTRRFATDRHGVRADLRATMRALRTSCRRRMYMRMRSCVSTTGQARSVRG